MLIDRNRAVIFRAISRTKGGSAILVLLAPALSGCVISDDSPRLALQSLGSLQTQEAMSSPSSDSLPILDVTGDQVTPVEPSNQPSSSGESATPTEINAREALQTLVPRLPDTQSDSAPDAAKSGDDAQPQKPSPSVEVLLIGTRPEGRRMVERARNNLEAADLLDHWGHRHVQNIVEGLFLSAPASGSDAAGFERLRAAAQSIEERLLIPDPQDEDDVRVLGTSQGVTYGRWAGGPADSLSIEFDFSFASQAWQENPKIRAMIERAGKVWSQRIPDTWSVWRWAPGARKGSAPIGSTVKFVAGPDGEISSGVEIVIIDDADLAGAGRAYIGDGISPAGESWEPRFAVIELNREYIEGTGAYAQISGDAEAFRTTAHEIGHVLGAWLGGKVTARYGDYVDSEAGTWSGPHVVAVHGGPAPFQDLDDPRTWVGGERDPSATQYDFSHSGVCASLLAYCSDSAALPAFLPHEIDFAFLADLGMTIRENDDKPETYGLAGWTDYAGFTVSVSRDLKVELAEPQLHYDAWGNTWETLDVTDLLQASVDAFGYRSGRDIHQSYPAAGPDGTVRYTGGLLGTAIDQFALPPVTGDATLAVDLGTLDGTASFTSLETYTAGTPETFGVGALHYPFELSDNTIVGTDSESTLSADFYGPRHENVAGALRDPRVGLLASFGATHDDRPTREDVVASADYIAGVTFSTERIFNSDGSAYDEHSWHEYRCKPDCQVRSLSGGQRDWMPADESQVLSSTAGWDWRSDERMAADRDILRVTRGSHTSTDNARGRHVADSYSGTLSNSAYSTGFENYSNWLAEPEAATLSNLRDVWSGVQGTLSNISLTGTAGWAGEMLGYQQSHGAHESPFVAGLATIKFSLSDNSLDVAFSEVVSRDGKREVVDFGFDDLGLEDDGTFSLWNASGVVSGALFGTSHEEAAGAFNHNSTHILGSFGATRLPDTVTLEKSGTTTLDESVLISKYNYEDWGIWAKQYEEDIFGVFIDQDEREITLLDGTKRLVPGDIFERIEGTTTGHNPVSGAAVWSGEVRAFEPGSGLVSVSEVNYAPVRGNALLEVNFSDATVDVDFTDFEAGHSDMSWLALQLQDGAFQDSQSCGFFCEETIEGAFYGDEHQGVAGTFDRDDLRGVFGAVRN